MDIKRSDINDPHNRTLNDDSHSEVWLSSEAPENENKMCNHTHN